MLNFFSEYYFGNSGVFKEILGNNFYYLVEDFGDFSHIIIVGDREKSEFSKKSFNEIANTLENDVMTKEEFENIKHKILNELKSNVRKLNKLLALGFLNETKNIMEWAREEDLSYSEYKSFIEDIKNFEFLGIYNGIVE